MVGKGRRFLKEKYKNRIKTRKNVKSGINICLCHFFLLSLQPNFTSCDKGDKGEDNMHVIHQT